MRMRWGDDKEGDDKQGEVTEHDERHCVCCGGRKNISEAGHSRMESIGCLFSGGKLPIPVDSRGQNQQFETST